MKPIWFKLLPLVLVALLLNGCATTVPALSSITMTLTGLKTEGGRTVASVRYLNESVISIGLASTRHKIYVNGTLIGEGTHTDAIGLASAIPVVVNIPLTTAPGVAIPASGSTISYRMENRLTVLVGDRRVNADSGSSGSVNLP
ncbi:hypothetical protein MASR2M8_14330 [Opitutaceae bacterium]